MGLCLELDSIQESSKNTEDKDFKTHHLCFEFYNASQPTLTGLASDSQKLRIGNIQRREASQQTHARQHIVPSAAADCEIL